jgi:hypothetical protein
LAGSGPAEAVASIPCAVHHRGAALPGGAFFYLKYLQWANEFSGVAGLFVAIAALINLLTSQGWPDAEHPVMERSKQAFLQLPEE